MTENKIEILDHGFLSLEAHFPDCDLMVVNSARVSFGKRKDVLSQSDEKLITYLAAHKHYSPFRHVQLQFHLKAPEFLMRQIYKHCIGMNYTEGQNYYRESDHAWNEISGRYVDLSAVDLFVPGTFRLQSVDNKQASFGNLDEEANKKAREVYLKALENMKASYQELLDLGVAKEQARCIMPLAMYTEVYWTASLQSVANFIHLRDHAGAQFEVVAVAKAMQTLTEKVAPVSLKALLESY